MERFNVEYSSHADFYINKISFDALKKETPEIRDTQAFIISDKSQLPKISSLVEISFKNGPIRVDVSNLSVSEVEGLFLMTERQTLPGLIKAGGSWVFKGSQKFLRTAQYVAHYASKASMLF